MYVIILIFNASDLINFWWFYEELFDWEKYCKIEDYFFIYINLNNYFSDIWHQISKIILAQAQDKLNQFKNLKKKYSKKVAIQVFLYQMGNKLIDRWKFLVLYFFVSRPFNQRYIFLSRTSVCFYLKILLLLYFLKWEI